MNNASFLTIMEWARAKYAYESGLVNECSKKGWGFIVAGTSFIFKKEVKIFQRIYTDVKVLAADDKWLYMDHILRVNGEIVGSGVARIAITDPKRKKQGLSIVVPPLEVWKLYGEQAEKDFAKISSADHIKSTRILESFIQHEDELKTYGSEKKQN